MADINSTSTRSNKNKKVDEKINEVNKKIRTTGQDVKDTAKDMGQQAKEKMDDVSSDLKEVTILSTKLSSYILLSKSISVIITIH